MSIFGIGDRYKFAALSKDNQPYGLRQPAQAVALTAERMDPTIAFNILFFAMLVALAIAPG